MRQRVSQPDAQYIISAGELSGQAHHSYSLQNQQIDQAYSTSQATHLQWQPTDCTWQCSGGMPQATQLLTRTIGCQTVGYHAMQSSPALPPAGRAVPITIASSQASCRGKGSTQAVLYSTQPAGAVQHATSWCSTRRNHSQHITWHLEAQDAVYFAYSADPATTEQAGNCTTAHSTQSRALQDRPARAWHRPARHDVGIQSSPGAAKSHSHAHHDQASYNQESQPHYKQQHLESSKVPALGLHVPRVLHTASLAHNESPPQASNCIGLHPATLAYVPYAWQQPECSELL